MPTSITTINGSDVISTSRTDINTNFSSLNTNKIETDVLDTDTALTANSDSKIATQKATKAYVDASVNPTGRSWNEYAVDAVGTDSYAITVAGFTTYTAGQTFKFKAGTANTGACSLNVNAVGAKTIKKDVTSDLVTGDILANQVVEVTYDGTNFQIVSELSGTVTTQSLSAVKKLEVDTTEVTVSGSTAETTLFDTTVSGGSLSTNNAIRFEAFISTSGMESTGGETITYRLKYGATTIASCVITNPDAVVTSVGGFVKGYIVADSATNAQKGGFTVMLTDKKTEDDNQTTVGISKIQGFGTGTATEDSTADKTLTLTFQSSLNAASTNVTAEFWVVESIK